MSAFLDAVRTASRNLVKAAKVTAFVVPPALFIRDRIGWLYVVRGGSMAPTLNPSDKFLDWISPDVVLVLRTLKMQRNDIVVFREPGRVSSRSLIKRVVAMGPEDSVPLDDVCLDRSVLPAFAPDRSTEQRKSQDSIVTAHGAAEVRAR